MRAPSTAFADDPCMETIERPLSSTLAVKSTSSPKVDQMEVSAFTVPTETPESDGTFTWSETTLVLVRVSACGAAGLGYSFADVATATLIDSHLKSEILGRNALDISEIWTAMVRAIRNLGRPGICSMAISAVDNALWDLKARLLKICVADLGWVERIVRLPRTEVVVLLPIRIPSWDASLAAGWSRGSIRSK
jgi:Mandelate racemase / muconate lactonizing enzyme, N-terminal domain